MSAKRIQKLNEVANASQAKGQQSSRTDRTTPDELLETRAKKLEVSVERTGTGKKTKRHCSLVKRGPREDTAQVERGP